MSKSSLSRLARRTLRPAAANPSPPKRPLPAHQNQTGCKGCNKEPATGPSIRCCRQPNRPPSAQLIVWSGLSGARWADRKVHSPVDDAIAVLARKGQTVYISNKETFGTEDAAFNVAWDRPEAELYIGSGNTMKEAQDEALKKIPQK